MTALWTAINAVFAAIVRRPQPQPTATAPNQPTDTLSQQIIACATTVSTTLGTGLPEVIYENALAHELRKAGLCVCQKQAVPVCYDGMMVGDYTADLLVENTALIELRAVNGNSVFDTAQCTNYLKATGHTRSLLLNFGAGGLQSQCMTNGS